MPFGILYFDSKVEYPLLCLIKKASVTHNEITDARFVTGELCRDQLMRS